MKRQEASLPIYRIRRPVERIIHLENISGFALIGGAVVALILANLPWGESVEHFWHQHLLVQIGPLEVDESLVHWVNDGLMTIFFLVAGLEIKRELVVGDLRDPRTAALPAIAAVGGMVFPALFFLLLADPQSANGWGVPMATDIAFAVGVLTLLGNRVPSGLKLMLLTLAIVDDLGAILVIAIFYTASLNLTALFIAFGLIATLVALRVLGVWWMPVYGLVGVALWLALFESGVHATLAGVICGLMAPAIPRRPHETTAGASQHLTVAELKEIVFDTRESHSVVDRLIHGLHPITALLIVPIFALANTGVPISGSGLAAAAGASVSQAIVAGLVLGKPIGIVLASWLAVKVGIAVLPGGVGWRHMVGMGFLGGIGFTVSLFVTDLAFDSEVLVDDAKLAVLAGSILASIIGVVVLWRCRPVKDGLGPITFEEFDVTQGADALATPIVAAGHLATAGQKETH